MESKAGFFMAHRSYDTTPAKTTDVQAQQQKKPPVSNGGLSVHLSSLTVGHSQFFLERDEDSGATRSDSTCRSG